MRTARSGCTAHHKHTHTLGYAWGAKFDGISPEYFISARSEKQKGD